MKYTLVATLIVAASPVVAQDGMRASDITLNPSGLTQLLSGQTIEFFDGSKSTYRDTGRYEYTYTDDGPVWVGGYTIAANSAVCVNFDNGSARCDFIVKDGEQVVLITAEGIRFPVRNITVATR